MTNPRGFKGVFGMPGQIQKQSLPVIKELNKCNSQFYYFAETRDENLKTNENLIILFLGRLDNHYDLCKKFSFPVNSSDIDLLCRAYELFGENCTEHIIGDFSFAIFDKEKQELLLAKDQVGVKPLFYLMKEGCLFFATTIYDLVGLLKDKEPLNKKYIAKELLTYEQEVSDTFYQNIRRLEPAHYLAIGNEFKPRVCRYWEAELFA